MNKRLRDFARKCIIEDLEKCTEGERNKFCRIFSVPEDETGQYPSMDVIVERLDIDQLESVMSLIDRTLAKHQ